MNENPRFFKTLFAQEEEIIFLANRTYYYLQFKIFCYNYSQY